MLLLFFSRKKNSKEKLPLSQWSIIAYDQENVHKHSDFSLLIIFSNSRFPTIYLLVNFICYPVSPLLNLINPNTLNWCLSNFGSNWLKVFWTSEMIHREHFLSDCDSNLNGKVSNFIEIDRHQLLFEHYCLNIMLPNWSTIKIDRDWKFQLDFLISLKFSMMTNRQMYQFTLQSFRYMLVLN